LIERFCESILLKIRERQVEVAQLMTTGQCRTYEFYKETFGRLDELKKMDALVQDVYRSLVRRQELSQGDDNERGTESKFY
jgi:hypothetical protein